MISTILMATDGSEAAGFAERYAVELASRLGARLAGLSVVEDRFARGYADDGLGVTPPSPEPLATYLRQRAEAACRRLTRRAQERGVEASGDASAGIADDRIVERGQQVDLIALGRDGQALPHRNGALVGSTATAVMRRTSQSSLVVPHGAEFGGPVVLAFDGSPGARTGAKLAVHVATRLGEAIHVFVDSKDKGRAAARFRGGPRHRRHPAGAGPRGLLHPGPSGRQDRRLGARGQGRPDRDGCLRSQPHQRILPGQQRGGGGAHLADRGAARALVVLPGPLAPETGR